MPSPFLKTKLSGAKKFWFVIFTVILSFALLESLLRISGYIFLHVAYPVKISQVNNKGKSNILCLGDSFTQGFGAPFGLSYPEQLESMLHKKAPNSKISVFREFSSNSSTILKNLPSDIIKYNPDLIIIMTGCNDRWNLENCTYFKLNRENLLTKIDIWLSNLRIYKLLKISLMNLRVLLGISTPWFNQGLIDAKEEIKPHAYTLKNPTAAGHFNQGNNYFYSGNYDSALKEFKLAEQLEPDNPFVHFRIACLYLQIFNDKELGIKHAILMLTYGDSSILDYAFMLLYDSNDKDNAKNCAVISQMENIIKDKYQGQDKARALRNLKLLYLFANEKKEIERLLGYNLDQIIAIIKMHNIRIILMNYPVPVWQISDVLPKKANAHRIHFIDNYVVFEARLKQGLSKREDLFVGDGHCNAAGYNLIAENVYKVLIENKMIHGGAILKKAD